MSDIITLAHGGGGEAMQELLSQEIAVLYSAEAQWEDAAVLQGFHRMAMTTDSFVVSPLIFPGGDAGKLAATGTINDLAMRGASPRYMSVGLIIEEGLEITVLRRILSSLRATCDVAGVSVVCGDTKVVERGSGDGLFINTTGIGVVYAASPPSAGNVEPGDWVLVSGDIGDHGIAIVAAREELPLTVHVTSDCAPLHGLAEAMIAAGGTSVHALRDPTRGGLAAALNEIAGASGVGVVIDEPSVPMRPAVRAACEVLGFDPLHLANEGKLVAFVAQSAADRVLKAALSHPLGRHSAVIGEVISNSPGRVVLQTGLGTTRVLTMPAGELLPRIC